MALFVQKLLVVVAFCIGHVISASSSPNVILLVMDDWGYNDVEWHGHTKLQTPFLTDYVNNHALKIDSNYVYPLCSITRSAFLTGRYPSRFGLQSSVIENGLPFGLSIHEDIMTADFKAAGYKTYHVGKWHLGFHRQDMTPMSRGFDTSYGSLSPMIHYFTYEYSVEFDGETYNGKDLYENHEQITTVDTDGLYLTDWEKDRFIQTIDDHVTGMENGDDSPFFMYLAMHASHNPNEATDECIASAEELTCNDRDDEFYMYCSTWQTTQAQTICADHALEVMFKHLMNVDNGDLYENTLIVFLSDNGAPVWGGDNSPLRGGKKELFEGGVRTPSFVAGGYLNEDRRGQTFDLTVPFHVTDWYPTILSATGVYHSSETSLDGQNMWFAIQDGDIDANINGDNREFLYNVDSYNCDSDFCGAYRFGNYKLIQTHSDTQTMQFWFDFYATSPRKLDDGSVNPDFNDFLNCGQKPDYVSDSLAYDEDGSVLSWSIPCYESACLFDIANDPCEYIDLAGDPMHETVYLYMYNMLMAYYETQTLPLREHYSDSFDDNADPTLNENGFWQPWIRDYNANDDYVDFEDVMMSEENGYTESQDVSLSPYYAIAQTYKTQLLSGDGDDDEGDDEGGDPMMGDDPMMGNDESGKKKNGAAGYMTTHYEVLLFVSIAGAVLVLLGLCVVFVKWWRMCNGRNEEKRLYEFTRKDSYKYEEIDEKVKSSPSYKRAMRNKIFVVGDCDNSNATTPLLFATSDM